MGWAFSIDFFLHWDEGYFPTKVGMDDVRVHVASTTPMFWLIQGQYIPTYLFFFQLLGGETFLKALIDFADDFDDFGPLKGCANHFRWFINPKRQKIFRMRNQAWREQEQTSEGLTGVVHSSMIKHLYYSPCEPSGDQVVDSAKGVDSRNSLIYLILEVHSEVMIFVCIIFEFFPLLD